MNKIVKTAQYFRLSPIDFEILFAPVRSIRYFMPCCEVDRISKFNAISDSYSNAVRNTKYGAFHPAFQRISTLSRYPSDTSAHDCSR